jgi:hypothetical protein
MSLPIVEIECVALTARPPQITAFALYNHATQRQLTLVGREL